MTTLQAMGGAVTVGITTLLFGAAGFVLGLLVAYCLYERMRD